MTDHRPHDEAVDPLDLTASEREALAALPRERDPGQLLEERTVRALREEGRSLRLGAAGRANRATAEPRRGGEVGVPPRRSPRESPCSREVYRSDKCSVLARRRMRSRLSSRRVTPCGRAGATDRVGYVAALAALSGRTDLRWRHQPGSRSGAHGTGAGAHESCVWRRTILWQPGYSRASARFNSPITTKPPDSPRRVLGRGEDEVNV